MIRFIFLLILSQTALAGLKVSVLDVSKTYHPGDIAEVVVASENTSDVESVSPASLLSEVDKKQAVFFQVSPWQKDKEGWRFSGKLVFGAEFLPDSKIVLKNSQGTSLSFNPFKWDSAVGEIPKEFLYNEIELFSINWFKKHIVATVLVLLLISLGIGFALKKRIDAKKAEAQRKDRLRKLIDKVNSAQDLKHMTEIWFARDEYKDLFPHALNSLDAFFTELNKIQFRPDPKTADLNQLTKAKSELQNALKGENGGV